MVGTVFSQAEPKPRAAIAAAPVQTSPIAGQLRGSPAVQRLARMADSLNARAAAPVQRAPTGRPGGLPDGLRAGIEQLSGMAMDDVRVHRNSSRPAQMQAHAYAQGRDIHLAPGQERHLPHEAWHVVQQAQGRVRPTTQLKTGIAVNDDKGLEREADHMGARALTGVASLAETTSDRHPHQRAAIVQRVDYPKDSTGTIAKDFLAGEVQVNGAALQHAILEAAKKAYATMPPDTPGGFRLGSYSLDADGTLMRRVGAVKGAKHEEEHGMPYLPENQRGLFGHGDIERLIFITLHEAGQWAYLMNPANSSIFDMHDVIVDVDCQFDRTGVVGFHKDSRGTTGFVNLTFDNPEEMTSTEYYEDLEGDPGQEKLLPSEVQKDIALRRDVSKSSDPEDAVEIKGGKLPKFGRISFSDPNLYHSSPLMGHRHGSKYSNDAQSWPAASKEKMIAFILRYNKTHTKEEWETSAPDQAVHENYAGYMTALYHGHGLETNSERLDKRAEMVDQATKRKRRMSLDLGGNEEKTKAARAESALPRTFVRTWVRFAKKTT